MNEQETKLNVSLSEEPISHNKEEGDIVKRASEMKVGFDKERTE